MFSSRYRNRRIGDFLKEMRLTEGRNTGFRKIINSLKDNGSPLPVFYTDEDRLSFAVTIYQHPEFTRVVTVNGGNNGADAPVKVVDDTVNAANDPVSDADDLVNATDDPVFDFENETLRKIYIALKHDNTATYE